MRQNGNLNPGPPSLPCPYRFQNIFPVAEFKPHTFRGVHLNGIVNFVFKISLGIKHSSQNILPEKKKVPCFIASNELLQFRSFHYILTINLLIN